MTIAEAVSFTHSVLLDEATTKFWSPASIISYLDQGQRMFAALATDDVMSSLHTTTLLTLSAGTTSLTVAATALPSNCFQPRLARIRWTTTGKFRTALTVPLERLFSLERAESSGAANQDNPQVAFFANNIYVSPVSTGAISEGIQLFYMMTITQLATYTDTFTLNAMHHPIVCDWAIAQAFSKVGDVERATMHRENFYNYLQGTTGKWTGRSMAQPEPRRIAVQ